MQWTARRVGFGLWLLALLFAALVLVWSSLPTPAAAQEAHEGEEVFQAKCASCHTIGGGPLLGPGHGEVPARRAPAWLPRCVAETDAVLAEGDPIATELLAEFNNIPMPNLGLTDAEVADLIAYLATQTGGAPEPPVTATTLPGGAADGKSLFEGSDRFENGGPPCLACHSVAGIGALGGGALGPDLTGAFGKFGDAGLATALATIPFPTMNPIFDDQPLTPQEQGDLVAFLQQAAVSGRSTEALGQLILLAGAGAVILLALTRFLWRRRLTEVRQPMVAGPHPKPPIEVITHGRTKGP